MGLRVLSATLLTMAMAVMLEYAQRYLTANRSFEVGDMVAGVLGAAATAVWWYVVRRTHVLPVWEPPVPPLKLRIED